MKGEEIIRIEKNNDGEQPDTTKLILTINNIDDPEKVLIKVKEVMKAISQFAYSNTWPEEEEWKEILPIWFVESMTLKTAEDRDKDDNLWHFESWLENIKARAWVWWSSKISKQTIEITLETLDIPYLIDTLLYVFYAQNISMNKMSTKDEINGIINY